MKQTSTIKYANIFFVFWILFLPDLSWGQQNTQVSEAYFDKVRNTGYDFEDRNQLDSALFYYNKALENAYANNNTYNLATIYNDLAILYRKKADYVLSKNFHEKSLEIAEKDNDTEMVEDNLHGIGLLYEMAGDYDKAVEYYLKTLKMSQGRGEKEGIVVTLQNISKIYMQLNIKDLAINSIEQAREITASIQNDSVMANVLHDYGEILVHFGENEKALDKLTTALNTYEKVGYKRFIASSLVYIGEVYGRMGQQDEMLASYKRALLYSHSMDQYVLADLYLKFGNLYASKQELVLAKEAFEKSFKISETNGFKDINQKSAYALYEIAKNSNDITTALNFLQVSANLRDQIFNVEKTKNVAEMSLKYDNEKQQRALQALQLKQYEWMLYGAIFIFALVIFFLTYIAFISKKNNRLLEEKNKEIQIQNSQLKESNEVLRQYAYVAAHDLKEPLRTICSFINLLEIRFAKKINDPEATEYMQFISNGAKRMNVLLTDLLEYSSIFHQQPGSDNVNPKAVLDEVCTNLKTLIQTNQATVEYGESFPFLAMNRIHLVQIFQNLIGNALKFTNGRRPVVQVNCTLEGKDIVFSVSDNGIGIGERHREKIFNLFFRAHQNTTEYEGTGIGLSICKSLTEKYGGRIWFQSIENQGTTFYFSFPKDMGAREEQILGERKTMTA